MNIKILSIGKFRNSVFLEAYQCYKKRIKYNVDLIELELKKSNNLNIDEIISKEGDLILSNIKQINNPFIIALDETGNQKNSLEFANLIQKKSLERVGCIIFIIGGANGLDKKITDKANLKLSLGKMTFPHMMVRSILIEQIYRAQTIIENHPYHKN